MKWKKSSYSAYNGNCVEVAFAKSSHSGGGNCVEAGNGQDGMVHVRDSKNPEGPVLELTPAQWRVFLQRLRPSLPASPPAA